MRILIILLLLISLPFGIPAFASFQTEAEESTGINTEILPAIQPIITISRFENKTITQEEKISKKVIYKDDPEREIGEEVVINEGKDGKKVTTFNVTYFEGKEYSREKAGVEIIKAEDKIISKGTKIVWRTLDTPEGQIKYWRKLRVWATHYDSRCPGCDEWTATGMKQGKGVIAVDPKVIKLRSKVYVPGYGLAVAGDTGGAIKGNIIDLGFDDARTAGWYAHYVDIYLIN